MNMESKAEHYKYILFYYLTGCHCDTVYNSDSKLFSCKKIWLNTLSARTNGLTVTGM